MMNRHPVLLSMGVALACCALLACGDGHDDDAWAEPTPTPEPTLECIPSPSAGEPPICFSSFELGRDGRSTTCCDGEPARVINRPRELPAFCCDAPSVE